MLRLQSGDYTVDLRPDLGGGIAAFEWNGQPILRPMCGTSPLEMACFPLVPFSNRIANGRFTFKGRSVQLNRNFPGADHPHTLHGFGWTAPWTVVVSGPDCATLCHDYAALDEWPWSYRAIQRFELSQDGLTITLSIENRSDEVMPAGLGLHPYFSREADTRFHGLHRGEWQTDDEPLPLSLDLKDQAIDWWAGQPIASRCVDTAYTDRDGAMDIIWPSRGFGVRLTPSDNLPCTVIYTPQHEPIFCIEPVTHVADAINQPERDHGMTELAPGKAVEISLVLSAYSLKGLG